MLKVIEIVALLLIFGIVISVGLWAHNYYNPAIQAPPTPLKVKQLDIGERDIIILENGPMEIVPKLNTGNLTYVQVIDTREFTLTWVCEKSDLADNNIECRHKTCGGLEDLFNVIEAGWDNPDPLYELVCQSQLILVGPTQDGSFETEISQ